MKCGARVALGVAGGYFLGRTKKMKLALMLAGMSAGRRAGGPGELLKGGSKLLNASPELAQLTDVVRGRLLEAGKGAALAVATRQVESLTDRVGKRVESLGDLGAPRRRPEADEPAPADERAEDDTGEDTGVVDDTSPADEPERAGADAEDAEDEEPPPARRRTSAPATKAPSGRGGKSSAATTTVRRAGTAAGGGTRATSKAAAGTAGKAASGRKPARATRTRRGEGNG
ncbi:hypothetical protein ACU61A_33350 [Pseudonocardia sichuanensis]|uniref:DNA primase n=1 Tax=Pseudonocardia kunmingensis TaxID=630975 RepID=A0A543DJ76_9PSEU|nr:hypothetical protein [Pseudonocardia kunmingensis]TQM09371.1 hypothetical protein FB558_5128 [Pseudonocardia kunmingensis]